MRSFAGFDIGDQKLKMAYADTTGVARVYANQWGESTFPTAMFMSDSGDVVGTEAIQLGYMQPQLLVRDPKLKLGTDDTVGKAPDGTVRRARDWCRQIFAWGRGTMESTTGEVVDLAAITVPAGFTDPQILDVRQAAEATGVEVVVIPRESTACAVAAGLQGRGCGSYLIFDMGNATTDVTAVSASGNNLDVLANGGVPVAGKLFTVRLVQAVREEFAKENGFMPDEVVDAVDLMTLWDRCEQTKTLMSRVDSAPIIFGCRGKTTTLTATRADLENWCGGLMDEPMGCVRRVMDDAKLKPADLKGVHLFGGGSQTRLVAARLEKELGLKPTMAREPLHGPALGAVIMGLATLAARGKRASISGVLIPPPQLFIREKTAYPLGITVVLRDTETLMHSVVIPRGQTYPCDITVRFQLAQPNQTEAQIEILQGDPDAPRDNCVVLASTKMTGLPAVADRPHVIEIRFRLDSDGVAWVTARDAESGQTADMKIENRPFAKVA